MKFLKRFGLALLLLFIIMGVMAAVEEFFGLEPDPYWILVIFLMTAAPLGLFHKKQ